MALEQWALPRLTKLMPLDEAELRQIITYTNTLSDEDAAANLQSLLGDSPETLEFITSFNAYRSGLNAGMSKVLPDDHDRAEQASSTMDSVQVKERSDTKQPHGSQDVKNGSDGMFNPGNGNLGAAQSSSDTKQMQPPQYAPPSNAPPANGASRAAARNHTNAVIEAAKIRARDEVHWTSWLGSLGMIG